MSKKEIIVTGLTKQDLVNTKENEDVACRCFICKRSTDDKSVLMDEDDGLILIPIEMRSVRVHISNKMTLIYPLCQDCFNLVGGISDYVDEESKSG